MTLPIIRHRYPHQLHTLHNIHVHPKEFQNHCQKLATQYERNFSAFLTTLNEHSVIPLLNATNSPYICAVMMELTNANIAKKLGVSQQTVKRKLDRLCEKLGVNNKKELKEYLERNV